MIERDYLLAPGLDRPLHDIAAEICAKHCLSMAELVGPCRLQQFVDARHEAWWRARRETRQSLPQIARFFNRDHTTVMHGVRKYAERVTKSIPTKLNYPPSDEYQVDHRLAAAVR